MEDVEASVPELKMWKVNLLSVAEFYHTSGVRTKTLHQIFPSMKRFPSYHSVRFGEHLVNLCSAVLHNLDGTSQHWEKILNDPESSRKDQQTAKGFLCTWGKSGVQVFLTVLMSDVCSVFQELEKQLQKTNIIIPDVLRYRDVALSKLEDMRQKPYPGGKEEYWQKFQDNDASEKSSEGNTERRTSSTRHTLISGFTQHRNFSAIRLEVIASSINFLSQRLDDEQKTVVNSIVSLCGARTPGEFIAEARPLLESCAIREDQVGEFANEVYASFETMRPSSTIKPRDYSIRILHMLRGSSGLVRKFLTGLIVVSPHSMTVERVVSLYNILFSKLRTGTRNATINERLIVAWNGRPTASFDPKEAVAKFIQKKDRRVSYPKPDVYTNREFIAKFFNTEI